MKNKEPTLKEIKDLLDDIRKQIKTLARDSDFNRGYVAGFKEIFYIIDTFVKTGWIEGSANSTSLLKT